MRYYFATKNQTKYEEVLRLLNTKVLKTSNIEIKQVAIDIGEVRGEDVDKILTESILKVFQVVKRPVFLDYTSLKIEIKGEWVELNWNLMTKNMFEKLMEGEDKGYRAEAKTSIIYCDGKEIHSFYGSISGYIKDDAKSKFMKNNWDGNFFPEDESKNLLEIKKNSDHESSEFRTMREVAFLNFFEYLTEHDINHKPEYNNENNYIELKELIENDKVVLFVGSGISKNVGLPSWDQLISGLAVELGFEPEVYKRLGNNYKLAEYYKEETKAGISELRLKISKEWDVKSEEFLNNKIYKSICQLNVSTIYTTNYDSCLENALDAFGIKYNKVVKMSDLREIDHSKITVVKLHGDFVDDSSIVLTESSYFERMGFDRPLDMKLWVDFLQKTILFIGYSLEDINMRYLFYRINKLCEKDETSNKHQKHYIFMTKYHPIDVSILKSRNFMPIIEENDASIDMFFNNIVDTSKIFKKAIARNDLARLRLIQKSDLHNHAPYGAAHEELIKNKLFKNLPLLKEKLSGSKGFEEWTNKYINAKVDQEIEKEKFLLRVQGAFIQATKDSIDPLILNIGYCAKKYFDNSYEELIDQIKQLRKKHYNGVFIAEVCFKRNMELEEINKELELILKTGFFSAIDLIGDEKEGVNNFKEAYEKAKKEGNFILKAHVGETEGPEKIQEAIEVLNLDVINHGINIIKDEKVLKLAKNRGITFNVSPLSNLKLSYIKNYCEHPIKAMYNAGLNITISSDDLLVFGSEISQEYLNLYNHHVFSESELDRIRLNGIAQGKKYQLNKGVDE